jgi:hypothetical protein
MTPLTAQMAFRVAFRRLAAIAPAGRMVVKAAAAATVAGAGITVAFCGSSPAPAAGGKTLSTVPVVKDAAYYQAVCVVPTDREGGGGEGRCASTACPPSLSGCRYNAVADLLENLDYDDGR